MTHKDAGKYAKKHPEGTKPDPRIAEMIKQKEKDGGISCAAAHKIALDLNTDPKTVGMNIDLLELRIKKCQLGLFGYYPEKKIITPAKEVPENIRDAAYSIVKNGRISCKDAWNLAKKLGIKKTEMASALEAMKIKISPCQLGAF